MKLTPYALYVLAKAKTPEQRHAEWEAKFRERIDRLNARRRYRTDWQRRRRAAAVTPPPTPSGPSEPSESQGL